MTTPDILLGALLFLFPGPPAVAGRTQRISVSSASIASAPIRCGVLQLQAGDAVDLLLSQFDRDLETIVEGPDKRRMRIVTCGKQVRSGVSLSLPSRGSILLSLRQLSPA